MAVQDRERVCGRKIRHPARPAAMRALRSLVRIGGRRAVGLEAYLCPVCGFWHVGHAGRV